MTISADPHTQEFDLLEGWRRHYFHNDYDNEILHFPDKNHNILIGMSTLLRKLQKSYGLQRRYQAPFPNQLLELAYQRITSLTEGFCSSNGYSYIWHILNRDGTWHYVNQRARMEP